MGPLTARTGTVSPVRMTARGRAQESVDAHIPGNRQYSEYDGHKYPSSLRNLSAHARGPDDICAGAVQGLVTKVPGVIGGSQLRSENFNVGGSLGSAGAGSQRRQRACPADSA